MYFHLAKDDLRIVYGTIRPLAHSWQIVCVLGISIVCVLLGISISKMYNIEQTRRGCGDDCLIDDLNEWLQRNYNPDKYGQPNWRTLIEYIDEIDCDLARDLAKKHKGNFINYYIIIVRKTSFVFYCLQ